MPRRKPEQGVEQRAVAGVGGRRLRVPVPRPEPLPGRQRVLVRRRPHPAHRVPVAGHLGPSLPGRLEGPLHRLARLLAPAGQQERLPYEGGGAEGVQRVEGLSGGQRRGPGRRNGLRLRLRLQLRLGLRLRLRFRLLLRCLCLRLCRLFLGQRLQQLRVRLPFPASRSRAAALPRTDRPRGDAHLRRKLRLCQCGGLTQTSAFLGRGRGVAGPRVTGHPFVRKST